MCNPLIALAAVSTVSGVVQNRAQNRAADAQDRYNRESREQAVVYQDEVRETQVENRNAEVAYQEEVRQSRNRVFEETRLSSNANFLSQAAQVNLRIQQESESVSQQSQFIEQERAQASSSASVSAAAAGVSGNTVDALLQDFRSSAAMQTGSAERNLSLFRRQSAEEIRGLRANARNRTVSALPQPLPPVAPLPPRSPIPSAAPVQRPSTIGLIAGVAGSAASAYGGYQVPQQLPSSVQARTPVFFNQRPRGTARF